MTIRVSSVRISDQGILIVDFADGHRAIFTVSQGGLDEPTTLQQICLERGDATVALYNSPYQYPWHWHLWPWGITELVMGYTVEQFASYLRAAFDYISAKEREGRLVAAWVIIAKGARDIEELETGRWPAP